MVYLEVLRLPDTKPHMEVFHTWHRDFLSKDIYLVFKIKRMHVGTWKISSLWLVFIVLKSVLYAAILKWESLCMATSQAAGPFDTNTVLCIFR